ncbi:MAG: class I SAM-dependent methyltransferase [Planctomycetota bacterium]
MQDSVLRNNRDVYDRMARDGDPLCRPATKEEMSRPLEFVDQAGWLGESIAGWRVLCLAAGGGRQSAMYASAGADVTVVDLSGAMLELDRLAAAEHGYRVRVLQTSMEDLSGLATAEFDLVIHPVSTCYVPSVRPVFREVARVTRPGGLYVSQHKQPSNLQASYTRQGEGYALRQSYYSEHPVPAPEIDTPATKRLRERGAMEFIHRWQELIGTMCQSGFVIEDLTEPLHAKPNAPINSFADRATFVPPYVRIKARRSTQQLEGDPQASSSIIV